jgi:uncharacterized glyoxalase superfamily protein PhnB
MEVPNVAGWAVIPSIRVPNMGEALDFYQNQLGFTMERGDADADNLAISRGDARIMLEVPAGFYGEEYNAAIEERLGSASAMALYMEADDLEEFYTRLTDSEVKMVDPLAERAWGQAEFTIEDPYGNWLTFWKVTDQSSS